MSDAVREIILKPMLELYLPPIHLRRDQQAQARAIAAYETTLARFDQNTLQKAWNKVVAEQTFWVWPNPGTIAAACRLCQPHPAPPGEEELRRTQALEMADAYATRFMKTSQLAKLASREGWGDFLRAYVTAAAWVQAQLICGVQHIGWDSCLLPDDDRHDSPATAFDAYRQTIAKAVERGQIRVTVPKECIQAWKFRSTDREFDKT